MNKFSFTLSLVEIEKMLVETLINFIFCAVRYKMLCVFIIFPYVVYLTAYRQTVQYYSTNIFLRLFK